MENSAIGWTHHTWNPWWGCHKVSPACQHCYIGPIMKRSGNVPFRGPIRTTADTWRKPVRWNQRAAESVDRPRIFTCSMSDFFHQGADSWRPEAWETIRTCPHLDWLILTKRPDLIADRLPTDWGDGYPQVWLGVTVESQHYLHRIDQLAAIPAALRFVSAEPLLGPIDFGTRMQHIDWLITGCERAGKQTRRPMDRDWVRSIREQCLAAGKPWFHKQYYAGTRLAFDGHLDGEIHQSFPASPAAVSVT